MPWFHRFFSCTGQVHCTYLGIGRATRVNHVVATRSDVASGEQPVARWLLARRDLQPYAALGERTDAGAERNGLLHGPGQIVVLREPADEVRHRDLREDLARAAVAVGWAAALWDERAGREGLECVVAEPRAV